MSTDRRRQLAIGVSLFLCAALAFRFARASAGFWGIDDAGITYAASFELADHGSVGANVEGTPVEGYSNPLVFFVVALLRLIRVFDPVSTHVHLETLLFGAMAVFVWRIARRVVRDVAACAAVAVFAFFELATPASWIWFGSGLENLWVSCGLVALCWLTVRHTDHERVSPAWGVLPFLVALTRPEAPVYVAGYYAALVWSARPQAITLRAHWLRAALELAVTSTLYVAFLLWRRRAYGDWLPNTYYAKMGNPVDIAYNLRTEVRQSILPYAYSGLAASTAVLHLVLPRARRAWRALPVLLVVSLALPLTAGADFFMGEHRFATPFLTVGHLSYALLVGWTLHEAITRVGRMRWLAVGATLVLLVLPIQLLRYRRARGDLYLDQVTTGLVAHLQGGMRWEHQMRVGVPYAVVMVPDAGGALLVGGMQMVDDAYLTDYDMAHVGRYYGDPNKLRQLRQYEQIERNPDLVDNSTSIGSFDMEYVAAHYLVGPARLLARKDLVELDAIPADARPIYKDGELELYLSSATVTTAAPRALVRCELIVAWHSESVGWTQLRARVGEDQDQVLLQPYQPRPSGIERRALLVGAPAKTGDAHVMVDIIRDGQTVATIDAATLHVTRDFSAAAPALALNADPYAALRGLAWLREQSITRYGMAKFHTILSALRRMNDARKAGAGKQILKLRWNARLATFEDVPAPIRASEAVVKGRMFALCRQTGSARTACLGRVIDELRRFGYLSVVAQSPEIERELQKARASRRSLSLREQYETLVGLTFAFPSDIALRRELIATRRALVDYPRIDLPH